MAVRGLGKKMLYYIHIDEVCRTSEHLRTLMTAINVIHWMIALFSKNYSQCILQVSSISKIQQWHSKLYMKSFKVSLERNHSKLAAVFI